MSEWVKKAGFPLGRVLGEGIFKLIQEERKGG